MNNHDGLEHFGYLKFSNNERLEHTCLWNGINGMYELSEHRGQPGLGFMLESIDFVD